LLSKAFGQAGRTCSRRRASSRSCRGGRREESAENYKASTREAFNGKALAIVQSGDRAGPITVTASAPGLAGARTTLFASGGHGSGRLAPRYVPKARHPRAAPAGATADASYSGKPDTLPAAMLDGNPATAWSNYYLKAATALLPSFSLAHAKEWVSVAWPGAQSVGTVRASFIADATRALPADIAVKYWDGGAWVAVSNQHVTPASASGEPTEITFDPVSTTRLRLDMTSAHPKAGNGFIAISALEVPAAAVQ
jgi:beta-galactosidase